MNSQEIVTRAKSLCNDKYWYGGKHEIATVALAKRLQKENPSTWTASYYNKALNDIGKMVCDCSGLCCYAYQYTELSSWGLYDKMSKWSGKPLNGMICWRKGHVGIYNDGLVIQMRGIDYDYQELPYVANEWSAILYDKAVNYNYDYPQLGWLKDDVGWWYATGHCKGDYYKNEIALINGKYYAFDKRGYMVDGCGQFKTSPDGDIIEVG